MGSESFEQYPKMGTTYLLTYLPTCLLEVVLHAQLNLSTAENLAKLTGRFREVADDLREVSRRKGAHRLGTKISSR